MKHTIALIFCSLLAASAMAGDPVKGKEKSAVCGACHGADGNSETPDFPRLAGQQEDYLRITLSRYKNGKRKDPIMNDQTKNLSNDDMDDLAAYFSSQKGLTIKK